jgi:hypothetical protein
LACVGILTLDYQRRFPVDVPTISTPTTVLNIISTAVYVRACFNTGTAAVCGTSIAISAGLPEDFLAKGHQEEYLSLGQEHGGGPGRSAAMSAVHGATQSEALPLLLDGALHLQTEKNQ